MSLDNTADKKTIYLKEGKPGTPTYDVLRIKTKDKSLIPEGARNIGSLCHERHKGIVHLDFSRPSILYIKKKGGDFLSLSTNPPDRAIRVGSGPQGQNNAACINHAGGSACWGGVIYVSWREYTNIEDAIAYLKAYFNVIASPENQRYTQDFIDKPRTDSISVNPSSSVKPVPVYPVATTKNEILISPPYPNPISNVVKYGTLAIPDLNWVASTPTLALSNGAGTLPAMFTTIQGRGFGKTLKHYLPHVTSSHQISGGDLTLLETGIIRDINIVVSSGKPYQQHGLLPHIAVGIHFWGGNSGRNAFVRGDGFFSNCPVNAYANMVESLISHPSGAMLPAGHWDTVYKYAANFTYIGVSFATKHISFWSKATTSSIRLPILDSIIYRKFISPKGLPQWQHYVPFVKDFENVRRIVAARPGLAGITLDQMERQLFNWINTPAAQDWNR